MAVAVCPPFADYTSMLSRSTPASFVALGRRSTNASSSHAWVHCSADMVPLDAASLLLVDEVDGGPTAAAAAAAACASATASAAKLSPLSDSAVALTSLRLSGGAGGGSGCTLLEGASSLATQQAPTATNTTAATTTAPAFASRRLLFASCNAAAAMPFAMSASPPTATPAAAAAAASTAAAAAAASATSSLLLDASTPVQSPRITPRSPRANRSPLDAEQLPRCGAMSIHEEFALLNELWERAAAEPGLLDYASAQHVANRDRNRYRDVLALENTRVRLPLSASSHSDYINANLIAAEPAAAAPAPTTTAALFASAATTTTGPAPQQTTTPTTPQQQQQQQLLLQQQQYIACQAPLANTVNDFWRMVWTQRSAVVVMLCAFEERGRSKCARYLPESVGDSVVTKDHVVTLLSASTLERAPHVVVRSLEVRPAAAASSGDSGTAAAAEAPRRVTHLQYTEWPDMGVAADPQPVWELLLAMEQYARVHSQLHRLDGPPVVHCSAGIGRAGTFLTAHQCLVALRARRSPNIVRIVHQLRRQRPGCVQTEAQYIFVHRVLEFGLHSMLAAPQLPESDRCFFRFVASWLSTRVGNCEAR